MNVIGIALEELYRIFDILNRDKFNMSLSEPVITIQKTKGRTLGHFTVDKTWRDKNNEESEDISFYEINIDPRWFNSRTPVEITETLLHEMCHYSNKLNNIKDCNGNVHNKKFKKTAEDVGLIVEKNKSNGYGITSLSDELKIYINENVKPSDKAFEYFRASAVKSSTTKNKKKNVFKYACPMCGQEAKGKKDIAIKCGFCDVLMEIEDENEDDMENIDSD